jgi:hypothetical protein
MAHFAEVDNKGIVLRVLVVPDEQEERGQDFLSEDLSLGGTWVQTSYNSRIRKNFAGVGFTYDPIDDAFIAPMPKCGHEELLLNDLKRWECAACEAIALQSRTTA